jgi:hypothetical protein
VRWVTIWKESASVLFVRIAHNNTVANNSQEEDSR